MLRFIFVLLTMGALLGCSSGSEDYRNLQNLDRTRWVDYARDLALPRRMALYEEVYEAGGHPPDPILSAAFSRTDLPGLKITLDRIRQNRDFSKYYPIILEISDNHADSPCDDNLYREIIAAAVESNLEDDLIHQIEFGSCKSIN